MNKIKLKIQEWDTPICEIRVCSDLEDDAFSILLPRISCINGKKVTKNLTRFTKK